jgi:deoxyribose-phosphate aldolase
MHRDRVSERLQHNDVKCFEASQAVRKGAGEVRMVINLGMVKEKAFFRN